MDDDPLLPRLTERLQVRPMDAKEAREIAEKEHYLHRKPQVSYAFGLYLDEVNVGVVTFGCPASRELQKSACPSKPDVVTELNRLWVDDSMPKNSESYFVSRALKQLPPLIVVSFADTREGHYGYVYRAINFHYYGYTDMTRKTPRFDYIPVADGAHSRDAFRNGYKEKVRRKPKARYFIATGDKRQRRELYDLCGWKSLDWKEIPTPNEHKQVRI